jgi:hypothetical protein
MQMWREEKQEWDLTAANHIEDIQHKLFKEIRLIREDIQKRE